MSTQWFQEEISLAARPRGCHLVTGEIVGRCPWLAQIAVGWFQVFLLHTSASLTLNENADPDVRRDMAMAFDRLVPESWPYVHTCEGPDDMPAHIKATLTGNDLTIPIRKGRLALGTWQGVYLCEHRDRGGSRSIVVTASGQVA